MNEKQARTLKQGDAVVWIDGTKGTVTEVWPHGVLITWSDGQPGGLDFRDMSNVNKSAPVTYTVATAPGGFCVVMTDETGRRTVIDAGSTSYERTKKIADRFTRHEAKAANVV